MNMLKQYQPHNKIAYKNSFNVEYVWIYILIFGATYILKPIITPFIDKLIVEPILSNFPQDHLTNFIILSFLLYSLLRLKNGVKLGLIPPINSLFFFTTIIITYIFIFRIDNR